MMFGKKEDIDKEIQKVEGEAISSIIDKSMIVTGEIQFKGKTRIDGTVNGNVRGEHLLLSKDGRINGDITVSSFVCQGMLVGNIEAKILTAKKGSTIRGKIAAVNLTVEPGASLDGQIKAAAQDSSATGTATVAAIGPGEKAGDSQINPSKLMKVAGLAHSFKAPVEKN